MSPLTESNPFSYFGKVREFQIHLYTTCPSLRTGGISGWMPQLWIEAITVKIGKLENLRSEKDLRADQTEFVIMDMNDVEQKTFTSAL